MVGFDAADDAAVSYLSDAHCIVHTLDFFPPLVDDPFAFGQIAAANALSDVYAMGGEVLSALNILSFPSGMSQDSVQKILAGGNQMVLEAGINISGGHSIQDQEPKYGLSVVGVVAKDKLWRNQGAKVGDRLVLTKALGSGVLSSADKQKRLDPKGYERMLATMIRLNKYAAKAAHAFPISACTDITGFGLVGHAAEMAAASKVDMVIDTAQLPLLPQALEFAEEGILPGGAGRNRAYVGERVQITEALPEARISLCFDPQTSGGLLLALPASKAEELVEALHAGGDRDSRIIGEVLKEGTGTIVLR